MRASRVGLLLLLRLPGIAGIGIGVSLSFSGSYYSTTSSYLELPVWARPANPPVSTGQVLTSERGCYYCDRVNETLHVFLSRARATNGVDIQLTVMDDGGNFRRCRQNYNAMAADSSIDYLLGPSFEVWETAINRIAHNNGKLLIGWVMSYPSYITDFRTQLCPYCDGSWQQATAWVSDVTSFNDAPFQTSLISTARASGVRVTESPWVIPTQPPLQNLVRPALNAAQQAVLAQQSAGSMYNVSWGFTFFPNASRGAASEAECIFFQEIVHSISSQVETSLLPMSTYVTSSFLPRRDFDVLVFCGTTNAFGQAMVKAQAQNWRFQALITSFASGTRSLFRYGGPFVNYIAEPLAVSAVLPNATDSILGSYDILATTLGFEPDMASLQAATAASLLVQALQISPSTSGADVAATLRNSTFETLFGPFGFDISGARLEQPFAFRQFLPSNINSLMDLGVPIVPGEMNSNIVLVSPQFADICQGDNSSLLCKDVVLSAMEFPMPGAAARYRQANMCPDGTSLEGTSCQPCDRGFYRAGEMVSCEPCAGGTYADLKGAGNCRACPIVALTCLSDQKPVVLPGFFVFEDEFAYLSTSGFEPIKLESFAFLFAGYYDMPDLTNITKYSTEFAVSRGATECAQLCDAAEQACIGFLFIIERARCVHYRDGAQYFPMVENNRMLLYLKEEVYATAPKLMNASRPEYPQPPTELEWAICPSPMACSGGTACTEELNHGLFCSQCQVDETKVSATNPIFPASRLCSLCPSEIIMWGRILVVCAIVISLMMFLALKARSAKGTYARIALPAMKLLLSYTCVLGTLADSNQLMLQGTLWLILRIPMEMLLRPWYMMQIDCVPLVLNWPARTETHGYVHHEMVKGLDRSIAFIGLGFILFMSLATLCWRLIYFCFDNKARAVAGKDPADAEDSAHNSEGSTKITEMSTDAYSEETDSPIDHKTSRWTAFGHGLAASTKHAMARYRFLFMHEEFLLYREVSKIIRRTTIFAFWFMPVYLRTQVKTLRCYELDHIHLGVMIEHPDVVCGSAIHDEMRTDWQFLWGIIAYPASWALIVLLSYRWKNEAATMGAVAFLNAGYKYGMYWWDILLVMRTSLSFLLMALPGRILRIMAQMTLIALVSMLENSVRPWSRSNNGVLQKASNLLSAGLLLTATIAAWDVQQRQNATSFILNFTALIISGLSMTCSVAGILLLLMNVIFDEFFAPLRVLLQNGAATGSWTRMFYVATAWMVGGLHELHLWRGSDGRWVMSHSQLSRLERSGLVMLLVDILEQCLTLRGQFRMRQVETVLLLAFQNAAQVRRGTVQNDFYMYGTAHHPLTIWGFPRVASQDPDISPNFDLKVTLTELQTALEMVSNDIQSGDPEVMTYTKAAVSASERKRRKSKDDDHKIMGEVLIWDTDFQDIEGKVVNHRQSQLKEHEASLAEAEVEAKRKHHRNHSGGDVFTESHNQVLRHLEELVVGECDILLTEFDQLAQEHIAFVTNVLGAQAREIEQELKEGLALAADTETWCEEPLPSFDRGRPEVSSWALRKAEASRKATLLAHEVREKADKVNACLQAYMEKAQESLQSAVQGVSIKGKRMLYQELTKAQGDFNNAVQHLAFQSQECKRMPDVPPPLPAAPAGTTKAAGDAASEGQLSEGNDGAWFGINCLSGGARRDKELTVDPPPEG